MTLENDHFELSAFYHAMCMSWRFEKLNYKQISVLFYFVLNLRKRFPRLYFFWPGKSLFDIADQRVDLAGRTGDSKPHDLAVAYIDRADAQLFGGFDIGCVLGSIDCALRLSENVILEEDTLEGLEQLVYVYNRAGDIYASDFLTDYTLADYCIDKANTISIKLLNWPIAGF